jgi:DNA mismatch repair protein MutL
MTMTAVEFNCALENTEFFEELGFEVEQFGDNSIIVRSAPDTMDEQDIKDAISDIVTMLMQNRNNAKNHKSCNSSEQNRLSCLF